MMRTGYAAYPWVVCFAETLTDVNVNSDLRGYFTIPQLQHGLTFAVWCALRTAGNATIELRFGWQDADAAAAVIGIDFPAVNAADQTFTRSIAWLDGAANPGADGSAPSMAPPRVAVYMTNGALSTLDYAVLMAGFGLF